ncbi:MAG: NUDIX hydrolase [Calditrichota bacterium]
MADLTEKQLTSEKVYEGKLLHVYRDEVRLPDGRTSIREYIRHPGAAVMVPFLDNGNLIMERQFRYPLREELWELPAGKIDPGESPLESAKRELQEETGYRGETFTRVGILHPCIGYSNEVIYIYMVEGLTFHRDQQDKDEFVETFEIDLDDALEAVRTGRITDAKSMVGVLWGEKFYRSEWPVASAEVRER